MFACVREPTRHNFPCLADRLILGKEQHPGTLNTNLAMFGLGFNQGTAGVVLENGVERVQPSGTAAAELALSPHHFSSLILVHPEAAGAGVT